LNQWACVSLRGAGLYSIQEIQMIFKSILRASACALALSAINSAKAEEALPVENAEEGDALLVIGQKDAPINIEPRGLAVSLGKEQFAGVNAFNTEDLMKYAPNFFVRKRFTGDSNGVPGFRGTHSTQSARSLVMVDGFVVSNFLGNSFGFSPKWGAVGPGEVEQFDIVYGPYSSRYTGNSMGGIVNISTRDPKETEAFATAQGFIQPYKQYGTDDRYSGYSGEAGFGLKQKDGPLSLRVSTRLLENRGQPMSWYSLTPATGTAPGIAVTGAVIDEDSLTRVTNANGVASVTTRPSGSKLANSPAPIFAAQSPADISQSQSKLKIGYDDGSIKAQALFIYWWNLDRQYAPESYLSDASGNPVYEGRVTTLGRNWNAAGANFSRTSRKEYLAGFKVEAPLGPLTARLNLSTYQTASSRTLTSNGYVAGANNGAGTLAEQGPTAWYTADLSFENLSDRNELAFGATANLYQTDQTRFNVTNWRTAANPVFTSQTFGKTQLLAAWIEDTIIASDFLRFTGGIRVENWRAFDGGIGRIGTGALAGQRVFNSYADREDTAINPTVSAQAVLGPNTQAQLSMAMATRFPTVGELFQGSLNGDGSFNINSFDPNLKPESSRDLNFLVAHDMDAVKLTGSFFWQQVDDTLFSVNGFNQNGVITSSFKNIDRTRQYGVELIAETRNWPVQGMSIDANAAYNNSKTVRNSALPISEGVAFPRIPTWRLNANLRYDFTDSVQGSLGARYASRPNTNLEGTQRGDSFGYTSELFALDARVNWQLPAGLRLSAGVDNITNNKAWVFHPYPQRTFLIEAGWKL
jgi:iron complex outermembrane recepter protein